MSEPIGTIIVSVPEAARLLGISERAVRKRINTGALDATREGHGPWQVRLGAELAVPVGIEGGTMGGTERNHDTARSEPIEATYSTSEPSTVALVPLAAVADQLQGLADRLAELAQRNEGLALEVGQLRERTATQQDTIAMQAEYLNAERQAVAELRRRAEVAEAERDELRRQAAPEPSGEAPTILVMQETPATPAPAGGFWQRVRRAFSGE